MLTTLQAILLGGLQGLTELFPISSLGHSVILPALFHWPLNERADFFLSFLVATHFATALVLFGLYFKDWMRILGGLWRSVRTLRVAPEDAFARLGWLLVIGTIPAGLIGLAFQHKIQEYLLSATVAAFFLMMNGVLLYGAEKLRRRAGGAGAEGAVVSETSADERLSKLSYRGAFTVGIMQCLALIPGFSRTGASFAGGLLVGLTHEDALRFSFLLATPIIGAAALLKLPHLIHTESVGVLSATFVGAIAAGIFAYLSARFLARYFSLETRSLLPFAVYCVVVGAGSLLFLLF